jgi:cytochrome subunit of sulfide dehydrogenase
MHRTSRMAVALLLAVTPVVAAQAAEPNAGRDLAATCTTCHATSGASQGAIPVLAPPSSDDLLRKLQEFKHGTRPGTVMPQLAKGYSDAQLAEIAAWFAAQAAR